MSTTTSVKVISMVAATDRRKAFAAGAQSSSMPWDFFAALRSPPGTLIYDEALAIKRFGRPLKPGEIGCYASHFAAWEQFLASAADQLVIFEDDIVVDWPAVEQLCRHDLGARGIHILKLFATHPVHAKVVKYKLLSDHSHLIRLRGYTYGTQAYVLSRHGAAALYASCRQMTMPVDWAMSRYWDYGVPNYAVFPFPILERYGPSTIEHAQALQVSRSRLQRYARFSWRIKERASRAVVDLLHRENAFGPPADVGAPYLGAADVSR